MAPFKELDLNKTSLIYVLNILSPSKDKIWFMISNAFVLYDVKHNFYVFFVFVVVFIIPFIYSMYSSNWIFEKNLKELAD